MDETFLTTEEVLEYLQVNLRTVYRLIKAGKIPAVRVGRQWRFRKRDIDAWLDSQRPRGGSRAAAAAAQPSKPPTSTRRDRPRRRESTRPKHPHPTGDLHQPPRETAVVDLPITAVCPRACLLIHVTGSRSQIRMEATSTVPVYMYSRLS